MNNRRPHLRLILRICAWIFLIPTDLRAFADGPLEDFLGKPSLTQTRLFSSQRFPNVVATKSGAVLAVWGQTTVQSHRSTDGGALTWTHPQKSTVLPDGNTNSTYGLMGGMVRLPVA